MDIYTLGRREVVSILFKHMKLLLGLFLGIFILVFLASFIFTPKYKAEAPVLVQTGREFQSSMQASDNPPAGVPTITKQEIINTEAELLDSPALIESTIRTVGLARIYPDIATSDATPEERMSKAVRKFTKSFKVKPVVMSNIITLDYWNADRGIAMESLQKLGDIYQSSHADIFGNKSSGIFESQTNKYEKQLEDVTQKINDLKNTEHLSDITYEREQLIQDRSDVEAKLRDIKTQSIDARQNLDYFGTQLKTMPEMVLMNQNSADAVETAKTRLLDLQTQLLQLKERFAPGNKDADAQAADLQNQIASIQSFIANPGVNQQNSFGRNATYDEGRMKLQDAKSVAPALDQKIAYLTAEDQRIQARLKVLDDGEAGLEILTRNQDALRELVHEYRGRFETAKVSLDLDKERAISVSMAHEPVSDLKPDKPNRLLFAAVGFVLAVFSTGVVALYLLAFRDSVITSESLERILRIKVIGVVPDFTAGTDGGPTMVGD